MSDAKSPPDLSMDEILATIRRIVADDERTVMPTTVAGAISDAGARPAMTGAAIESNDILELTEAVAEDGSVRHLAPIGGAVTREPDRPASLALAEQNAAATLAGEVTADETGPGAHLVSETTSLATASAFARLASTPREVRTSQDVPLGADGRTLEGIVSDLLRPLLKTWLDENLPLVVERLVKAEIARVAGNSGRD